MGRFQFAGRTSEGFRLASALLFVAQFHGSQRNWSSTSPESASQFEFCRGSNASGWTITIPHKTSGTSSACVESQIDCGTSEAQITRSEFAPARPHLLITPPTTRPPPPSPPPPPPPPSPSHPPL